MNATTSRKGLQPATGSCHWLSQPNRLHQGGVLQINGTAYTVDPILDDDTGALLGHRLSKADGGMYDIDRQTGQCDCPDATFRPDRPGGCKHSRALQAALRAIGL
jgi:hypothetical protein